MNHVNLMGRICKDPETRYSQNNTSMAVTRFTVACDRKFKKEGEQTADFINCISFGKCAEIVDKYFKKGMRIALDGRIQTGSYTNKDGKKVYTTDIVAESVEFCESKGASVNADDVPEPPTNNAPSAPSNSFMDIPENIEDDLPFK